MDQVRGSWVASQVEMFSVVQTNQRSHVSMEIRQRNHNRERLANGIREVGIDHRVPSTDRRPDDGIK